MKKHFKYIFLITFIFGIIYIIYRQASQTIKDGEYAPPSHESLDKKADALKDLDPEYAEKQQVGAEGAADALSEVAHEMSREICRQERELLWQITEPPLPPNTPPGTVIPLGSETILTASQAMDWLKRTNISSCFAFRKNNAERLFHNFVIDEKNYRSFYQEFNRVLQESRGFAPYTLIKKAIGALDGATNKEAKLLRERILSSLETYINDASAPVDLMGAFLAVKDASDKGIINSQIKEQIDVLQNEFTEAGKSQIAKHQQHIHKYLPSDPQKLASFSTNEIADFYGYEGTKLSLDLEREDYDMTRGYARRLHDLVRFR